MKKILLIGLNLILLAFFVFSEEDAKEKKVKPFISIINESEILISAVEQEVDQDSDVEADDTDEKYNEVGKDNSYFNGFDNNTSVDAGLSFKLNDLLSMSVFVGLRDLNWLIDAKGAFQFASTQFYGGLGLDITSADFFEANLRFSNYEVFETEGRIKAGIDLETSFTFTFEKAFIDFTVCNNFKPAFNRYDAAVNDVIGYDLTFNFFNFINDNVNTGLYIEGEFDSLNNVKNFSTETYEFSNEFFAGIKTNPVEYFSGYLLFAMFNEGTIEDDQFVEDSKINSFGLKAGINFEIKWFNIEAYYIPKIGVYVDNERREAEHVIGFNISFDF